MGIDSFSSEEQHKKNKTWTKDEIIDGIKKLAKEKEDIPRLREASNFDELPSHGTIQKKFNSWNNALDKAGFNVNEKHGKEYDDRHTSKTEESAVDVFNEVELDQTTQLLEEHTNKSKGEASELIITAELLKRNINVLAPYGEDQRYDIVIDISGELVKVQCKTGKVDENGEIIKFSTQSASLRSDGYEKNSYGKEIDYFAVYAWGIDELFLVHRSKVADTVGRLRLTRPKNNQVKGVTFAAEHHIDEIVQEIKENDFVNQT